MKPPFGSMTVGLAVGVTAAVVIACAGGAYLYSKHHMRSLLETARTTALAEGDLIRVALEHQMIENDRTLIARMVESFRKQARVERLLIIDRTGAERYASGPPDPDLRLGSSTCQACHQYPPSQRGSSRVIETQGGTVLRSVVPIRNRSECHRCHNPNHKINGILIVDYNAEPMRAEMARDLRWLVGGTAAITLLLVGAIGMVIRLALLRRLQRFERAARQVAGGNFEKRVPADGSDIVSWLAREFNAMADSVSGLVGEVRHERERLERVINSIDDGIVVLDANRNILAANDAFLHRIDAARGSVLGRCCRDSSAAACQVADCPAAQCLDSGARQIRICERRTPAGTAWEEVHACPILDGAGKLLQVVEVWRDISDRRAAEARLAESHRRASVGMLASGFSHELNTPLATILTCVEGILREMRAKDGGDNGRICENASIAREQILHCRGITQHFLRISRGQRPHADIVDVEAAMHAIERLIEPTARAQSVSISMRPAGGGIHVRADEAELQHTLINLLLNAVQACAAGGRIEVWVEAGDAVHIFIRDNGRGIAPEDQKRIFEPFVSGRDGGTGLGLFLSLTSVRRFGGDILVDSAPGRGSTFEIVFPAVSAVEVPA